MSLRRQREAAWRWEENVKVAVRRHELSRVGGEARRNGATMRTSTSAAQPQCGQTGSVGGKGSNGRLDSLRSCRELIYGFDPFLRTKGVRQQTTRPPGVGWRDWF